MGIGSSFKKAVKKVGSALKVNDMGTLTKNLLTGGVYGATSAADKALGAITGTSITGTYQDLSGHTARAEDEARNARQLAEQRVLAAANADVSRDAADIVLGETSDTAGESLGELRKKRTSALSTQLGIS